MKAFVRALMLLIAMHLFPPQLAAQTAANPQNAIPMGPGQVALGQMGTPQAALVMGLQRYWILGGKVRTLHGDPIQGAKVQVNPISVPAEPRILKTDVLGQFTTEYFVNADPVGQFRASLTVTKKGYPKTFLLVDLGGPGQARAYPITLRSEEEDPELLSQADFLSALVPRLRKLGPADGLTAKGEKDYGRGVEGLDDPKHPDRALSPLMTALDPAPDCLGCRTMLALAELASGDWDGCDRNAALAAKASLEDRAKGRPEPLLILGVMESWKHEPDKAASFFMEALKFAPQDPLALQELGRSELLLGNPDVANVYLSKAVSAGAGTNVQLLQIKALLGGGHFDAADREMTRYLNGRDVKTMPLRVRALWAEVRDRKKVELAYAKAIPEINQPLHYLRQTTPELKDLEPAQDQKPLVSILEAVGKNVSEFFQDFPNTSSVEKIHQAKVGRKGKDEATQDSKYNYLCATAAEGGEPGFDEYRANVLADGGPPRGLKEGFMLTSGFTSFPLLFHPAYQSQSTFRYLGRQKLNGHDTFVVAFAQHPATAKMHGVFKSGDTTLMTFSQGLAWVDPESYQIVRLRADLLTPLPEIRLKKETTDIEFAAVRFNRLPEAFWLPREVMVTVDWNSKILRNNHSYGEFKLFHVESTQKVGKPK